MSNDVWHVALEPGTTKMQDVIVANLEVDDFEMIGFLLQTTNLQGRVYETERGGFLIMYGGEYQRPHPSVMIWRLEITEDGATVVNIGIDDAWIVEPIWREWLMPEETDVEFEPPGAFVFVVKKDTRQ